MCGMKLLSDSSYYAYFIGCCLWCWRWVLLEVAVATSCLVQLSSLACLVRCISFRMRGQKAILNLPLEAGEANPKANNIGRKRRIHQRDATTSSRN
ncbi:unnamed protein product [Trifolium pratense]|uniref:Uncharacterized protein n=1 Tax=Trifolium pratense TaxID=57577 RepID=A0ACB0LQR4_TRIPR|nr:unnamed protein product [Trifolium pratense]